MNSTRGARVSNDNDTSGSVHLIFQRMNPWQLHKEPALNVIAGCATGSLLTHCEIAIGEVPGSGGQMSNVLRIFNDDVVRPFSSPP
jgi:hypothetical protein